MIDTLKDEGRKYSLIYFKDKLDKKKELEKQMQIENIKKVFIDNDIKDNDNDEFNKQLLSLNFSSKNIDSFQNFSLFKNSIETEKYEPEIQKKKDNFPSSNKNIKYIDKNIINKDNDKVSIKPKTDRKSIQINNNIISEKEKKNNLNEDLLNVTQEQMKIFDDGVNKLYNDHKNNLKLKIFHINHPYLQNIKLINNNIESTTSSMTKEQRIFPILQKQKLILKKIQEGNNSRNNSLISRNNNDSISHSTENKDNKLNKFIFNQSSKKNDIHLTIDFTKKILDNKSSTDNGKNNSSEKINLRTRKNIEFKPYTLEQYKNKYEKNNNLKIFGGLGANLGGEEWNKRQKLLERKKHYSDFIKNDKEFYNFNKRNIKIINKKNEDAKTVMSKKESVDSKSDYKYKIFKIENNILNNNELKLPLINQRFKSNHKYKLKKIKNKNNQKYNINQEHDLEGSEKDLKQLIKQYEEYNEKFKL